MVSKVKFKYPTHSREIKPMKTRIRGSHNNKVIGVILSYIMMKTLFIKFIIITSVVSMCLTFLKLD